MKELWKKIETLFWAFLLLAFAFIFSVKLPPYFGVFVFVGFFTLSVGMFMKWFEEQKGRGKGE